MTCYEEFYKRVNDVRYKHAITTYGGDNRPFGMTYLYPEEIKEVIFNGPATIVIWTDGTKTVVKCGDMDVYDPEKGLAMAICKYVFGNEGRFKHVFRKWLPEEEIWDAVDLGLRDIIDNVIKTFTLVDRRTICNERLREIF